MAKKVAKRTMIDTGTDKRFVRREAGRFKESDDVGKSLASDRRVKAKTKVQSGQGDKGDRRRWARDGSASSTARTWTATTTRFTCFGRSFGEGRS